MNEPAVTNGGREKRRVALSSVLAAIFLTGFKLVVGLMTNSLGIIAEAAHSALDLGAACMTLFAVRISDKPADEDHHYGHEKIEGLSAFIEVLLLLATCAWIIYEAVERLAGKTTEVNVSVWAFAVMGISIIVDISRSRALYRVAKKHKSQALEADALHFGSDIWSSAVVIVGLVAYKFFKFPMADSIAALAVAVLVIFVSIRLAVRTIDVLLDRAPKGVRNQIEEVVGQIPDVGKMDSLRVRCSGARTFVDMRLLVASDLSFTEAHRIASLAEIKVCEILPGADVIVHVDPAEKTSTKAEAQAKVSDLLNEHRALFVEYHDLNIIHHGNEYIVNMHLVMTGDRHLAEVHEICDHLEEDIKGKIPVAKVTIHVEPYSKSSESAGREDTNPS